MGWPLYAIPVGWQRGEKLRQVTDNRGNHYRYGVTQDDPFTWRKPTDPIEWDSVGVIWFDSFKEMDTWWNWWLRKGAGRYFV